MPWAGGWPGTARRRSRRESRRPTPRTRHVEMAGACLDDGEGHDVQIVARDITERRRGEAALRESEERLTLAFAGAQEGVWDWNLETGAVVYSPRWKQMLGYADEEIEPHVSAWERLLHPDDQRPRAAAERERARAASAPTKASSGCGTRTATTSTCCRAGFPVRREPGGPVVRIVGTHLDITERKRDRSGAARERRAADAGVRRRAGRRLGLEPRNRRGRVLVRAGSRCSATRTTRSSRTSARGSACSIPTTGRAREQVNESVVRGAPDLRRRVPPAAQGRPLRPRAVARFPGPSRTGRTGRPHRRHALRPHRAQAGRGRTRPHGAARAPRVRAGRRTPSHRARDARSVRRAADGARPARSAALKDACARSRRTRANRSTALEDVAQRLDRDVDHLVWELRPTALDDLGLRAALANYVQDWSARVGIAAELHTSGLLDDRLPSEIETTLYRIAQEALTNVAKHSRAHERRRHPRAASRITCLLIVEDDGVGFEPGATRTSAAGQGFGLLGMQERAALVGATLQIESAAGQGTTILVRMAPARPPRRTARSCVSAPAALRILLADDHVTVRHGLKLLIDSQADMTGRRRSERRRHAPCSSAVALKPDVVVMDISMPGMNGLVATRTLEEATARRRRSSR